jgi:hypothetical protein
MCSPPRANTLNSPIAWGSCRLHATRQRKPERKTPYSGTEYLFGLTIQKCTCFDKRQVSPQGSRLRAPACRGSWSTLQCLGDSSPRRSTRSIFRPLRTRAGRQVGLEMQFRSASVRPGRDAQVRYLPGNPDCRNIICKIRQKGSRIRPRSGERVDLGQQRLDQHC